MRPYARRHVLVVLMGFVMSLGCDEDVNESNARFAAEESFDVTIARGSRKGFILEAINGAVKITGSASVNSISVAGVRRVESSDLEDAKIHLPRLEVVVDSAGANVVVETVQPTISEGRDYIVNYVISVPDDFEVTAVNANGSIVVKDFLRETRLNTRPVRPCEGTARGLDHRGRRGIS